METLLLYLAIGAFAGTLAGLFGVGGGLVIVPVLVFIFKGQGTHPYPGRTFLTELRASY